MHAADVTSAATTIRHAMSRRQTPRRYASALSPIADTPPPMPLRRQRAASASRAAATPSRCQMLISKAAAAADAASADAAAAMPPRRRRRLHFISLMRQSIFLLDYACHAADISDSIFRHPELLLPPRSCAISAD